MKPKLSAGMITSLAVIFLGGAMGTVGAGAIPPAPGAPGAPAGPAALRLTGGPARVALIELFTSEGCSSCPPAEQWLSGLRSAPGLWREFVPISYHVDYWDRLGWRDRFATRAFTERQYDVARAWGGGSVYTPCFVRDGEEWRPRGRWAEAVGGDSGMLMVEVGGDGWCRVEFSPAERGAHGGYEFHVAVLGGGYSSRVTAGENRGATLAHDFVALGLAEAALVADPSGRFYEANVRRPPVTATLATGAERMAIAAWVTRPGAFEVLQATGGWLPR